LRTDQFVEIAGQQQRRATNPAQRLRAVELSEGLELQVGSMQSVGSATSRRI
jgi:hypothetical protein